MSMAWVPPRWFRVLVVTPIVFVISGVVTVLSPVLLALLAVVDLVDRKEWRFSRVGGLGIALCVTEFIGLIVVFVLWVSFGFGLGIRSRTAQRVHNHIFGVWLAFVTNALEFFLGFDFVIPEGERIHGPILTLARHAGPGDAFLLARKVIRDYKRQLRMLGTSKLLWDPFLNHLMLRLPHHFLDRRRNPPEAELEAIEEMTASMDDDSVTIIFPEGGNWTPKRWEGAIDSLTTSGRAEQAELAASMMNVLPPRTAGTLAALGARPDATVVFVAHVGLGDLHSLGEIWRHVPLRRRVQATYWSVPAAEIPTDRTEFGSWLFAQWALIDRWISETRPSVHQPR
ncbi:MAG: 1-acyl-sn-glycerol-3-phosphate acyltransferase [Acidimicrobiales bacterium]